MNNALKLLVTGGTGLLGYNLVQQLLKKGYSVYPTYNKNTPFKLAGARWSKVNLEDPSQLTQLFRDIKPDAVIHTAAYTDVDGCELHRERAYRINFLASMTVARLAARHGSLLIYVSTDYVFDGDKGMYREEEAPNPINYYGLSKLLGEVATLSAMDKENVLVVRVSGLYGYSPTGKRNFGINVLEKLLRGEEVRAFYDQYLSPTYTYFLSRRLIDVLEREIRGVLHLAGERLSRLEFAQLIAKVLGADAELIKPISMKEANLPARRPRDSSLDTTMAKKLGLELPSQEESVKHFVNIYRNAIGV